MLQPNARPTGPLASAKSAAAPTSGGISTGTQATAATTAPLASAGVDPNRPVSRELDPAVNPYAAALREPGKSKRAWDADYIGQFQSAKAGDPVRFELTAGVMAEGVVKIIQLAKGRVAYVSGTLTAPEPGKFFFLTPPAGGKAGKAVGVVEFPSSKTAYRIEPTGPGGAPELWQRRLDEVLCLEMPKLDPVVASAQTNEIENIPPLRPDAEPDYVPSYNTDLNGNAIISLQSNPGSSAVLLLNFFGGYTPSWGGVDYAAPNVANSDIKDIWKRVAEDYMPFNINVTTDIRVYQAAPAASRQMCCFTTTPITAAGVAYEGSWNWGSDTPCWSVYCLGKPGAEVGAHEPGHTLGLSHDGQEIPNGTNGTTHNEYYTGQGSGATGWCPIMGAGYYQNVTTFSKGEYIYANNTQDQLNIIVTANNNVAYRADDTGGTLASSRYLEIYTNNTASAEGVIEHTADTDAFQFTTTGGVMSLTASPVGDWADLALTATLADATDTIIASNRPQSVLSASITTNLPAGTYTFRVTGAGRNDKVTDGFSSYASLGYYSVTGSVAGARMPTRLRVLEHATNNTLVGSVPANNPNSSPLVYAITAGNTGGTFSVDGGGVIRVANNTLLDYTKLATSTQYAVQFEVFMNITNLNNPALTELNRRVVIAVQQVFALVPTALTAAAGTSLRVNLNWFGSFDATSYHVKRSTVHGGPYTTVGSSIDCNYTDGGLTNGVTYYYVVTAVNNNGESGISSEASAVPQVLPSFGFETPSIGSGNYTYNPSGGFWIFGGSAGSGSGIVANGSGFSNPNAPEGSQAAFVQSYGAVSQTLSGFTPGSSYTITYSAAQRPGQDQHGGESWDVTIDNHPIKNNAPGLASYTTYTATFTATAATHNFAFVGTDLAGGDNTVFIDNVRISPALHPVTPSLTLTSPAANSVLFIPGTINLAAAVAANGNNINRVQFYSHPGTLIGEVTNEPYNFAWTNVSAGGKSYRVFARAIFNDTSSADSVPVNFVIVNRNPNFGFELPSIGSGNHQYNPIGGYWIFGGGGGNGSGILANGSAFSNPNAPEGGQAAFVQSYGVIAQTLSGFVPGNSYTITYAAAQRSGSSQNGGESWNVMIDGKVIQTNHPGGTSYASYATTFVASAATHTLSFVGTDLAGGDNTVFIDNVAINPPISAPIVTMNTLPVTAADVVGSEVTFKAAFSGYSPINYQWQKIAGGATNDIAGATNTTLTLANLQLTNTAAFQLIASNVFGVAASAPGLLTVSSVPVAVNNVIVSVAAQTGFGFGTFAPTWLVATNDSLIFHKLPSGATGNFSLEAPGRSVNFLTAAGDNSLTTISGSSGSTTSTNYVTCGNGGGAGSSVIYLLTGSAAGYNLTNITVYGGWSDAGRDQQAYTVYYSTVAAPSIYKLLRNVNYNPANSANAQSATRVTFTPAIGVLATNVAAVKFDFTTPTSENGYCGYTGIALFGAPVSTVIPPATNPTNLTFQVAASSLHLAWPEDHLGWQLQTQTNGLNAGIGTNWFDVAGSTVTNRMFFPINPANGSVFYRLKYQ